MNVSTKGMIQHRSQQLVSSPEEVADMLLTIESNHPLLVNHDMSTEIGSNRITTATTTTTTTTTTTPLETGTIPPEELLSPNELDPAQVEKLLAEELNQMSFDRRKRASEEVHGLVPQPRPLRQMHPYCYAFDTQTAERLSELQSELDVLCGDSCSGRNHSHNYRCSSKSFTTTKSSVAAYQRAKSGRSALLNDHEFRLSFLRKEEMDPKKAAIRLVNYLGFVQEIYETDEGVVPEWDDADLAHPGHLREAHHDPNAANGSVLSRAQKQKDIDRVVSTCRTKFGAIHICTQNTPYHVLAKAFLTIVIGRDNRSRLRFHSGSFYKCKASLKSFGIPVYYLPLSLSLDNACNLKSHGKWLASREALERATLEEVYRIRSGTNATTTTTTTTTFYSDSEIEMAARGQVRLRFVDCPYHEDCVFGKGRWVMNHPGNVAMRCLLDKQYLWLQNMHRKGGTDGTAGTKSMLSPEAARIVFDAIKKGHGRFLKVGSGSHKGLLVPVDDKTARQKISIAFRDLKIRRRFRSCRTDHNSSSSSSSSSNDNGNSPNRSESKQASRE
eukprot:jgi/Psemu1/38696/gm1.38696_g